MKTSVNTDGLQFVYVRERFFLSNTFSFLLFFLIAFY